MKRIYLALTALTFVPAGSGAANDRSDAAGSTSRPAEIRHGGHAYKEQSGDLPNFHQVHPFLYRGGEPSALGLKKLKEMGIGTIIDLRGHPGHVSAEAEESRRLGLETINLPMSSKAPTEEQIMTFLTKTRAAKNGTGKGPVFVHCAHGSDRTGCIIGLWRVVEDQWGYDDTYAEMRKYYFGPKYTELSGTVRKYAEKTAASR